MTKQKRKYVSGFGLMETAIVLIIFGLLAGLILKGQEVIQNARLTNLISEIEQIQIATHAFYDLHGYLPGDYPQGATLGDGCVNGNGDGKLEGEELHQFWRHLVGSGLMSIPLEGGGAISKLPGCKFYVVTNPNGRPGLWLKLSQGNAGILTPQQAQTLDRKIDDGEASSGQLQTFNAQDGEACVRQDGRYNLQNKEPCCIVHIRLF